MKQIKSYICGLILGTFVVAAYADSVVTLPSGPFWTGTVGLSSTQNYGYSFTVRSAPLSVTSLGVFSQNFTAGVPVGLWNASGSLLGNVIVPSGTGGEVQGRFTYASLLSPITLAANQTYILGAAYPDIHQMIWGYSPNVNPADVTIYSSAVLPEDILFNPSANLVFPSVYLGSGGSFGPNALFTVVPEPSTFELVLVGVLVFGFIKWIRRKQPNPAAGSSISKKV